MNMDEYFENDFVKRRLNGSGSFGAVTTCRMKHNRLFCAIKKYKHEEDADVGLEYDVVREIAHLSSIKHECIVNFVGAGYMDGNIVCILKGMQRNLKEHYRISPSRPVQRHLRDIIRAISHLHARSIYHRDVKPQNILVNDREEIRLADFGLAGFYRPGRNQTMMVCTSWYRPPEIFDNESYDLGVDVWSLGCVIVELITGEPLFSFDDENDLKIAMKRYMSGGNERAKVLINIAAKQIPEVNKMLTENKNRMRTKELIDWEFETCTKESCVSANMFYIQDDVNPQMRAILIDWLIEVSVKLKISKYSLQRTVDILDDYICSQKFKRDRLQLVGIVCMRLACKIENNEPFVSTSDWNFMCANAFTEDDIISMEKKLFATLNFNIAKPLRCVMNENKMFERFSDLWLFSNHRRSINTKSLFKIFGNAIDNGNYELFKYFPDIAFNGHGIRSLYKNDEEGKLLLKNILEYREQVRES